jgi:hypothetical protein
MFHHVLIADNPFTVSHRGLFDCDCGWRRRLCLTAWGLPARSLARQPATRRGMNRCHIIYSGGNHQRRWTLSLREPSPLTAMQVARSPGNRKAVISGRSPIWPNCQSKWLPNVTVACTVVPDHVSCQCGNTNRVHWLPGSFCFRPPARAD